MPFGALLDSGSIPQYTDLMAETLSPPTPSDDAASVALAAFDVRPITLPRRSLAASVGRTLHIWGLGARHMTPEIVKRLLRREGNPARGARHVAEKLGSTYIKFGQFAASAPGIVGEAVAEEFRNCLDTGPPVPFSYVRSTVEAELERPLADVFASFEEKHLAAASIAVVHRATLLDGTPVVVKVLRPHIENTVATDLSMLEGFTRFMAARGIDQMYNMVSLVVGLRMQIAEELDLRNEARTMDVFRDLYDDYGLSLLVVPHVHHDLTARRVLTMEFLDGAPLDDLSQAEDLGVDPAPLVRELLKAWVLTGLRVGAFHADIHAGNLLLLKDGRLGMLDWGIIAQMNDDSRRMFRALCEATVGNEDAWGDIAQEMIRVNGPSFEVLGLNYEQVRTFSRETFEPVLTKPLSEVSMSDLMMNGDDVVRKATGEEAPSRSLKQRLAAMRDAGRAYQEAARTKAFEHPSMRMGFLSIKQLVYLERYGRMYIPNESILGDPEFVREALDDAPIPAGP
jgi:predicted unusual protein kinase regulating ubiquinone biosynthesis (AarF/ABC1/UbiB family)